MQIKTNTFANNPRVLHFSPIFLRIQETPITIPENHFHHLAK